MTVSHSRHTPASTGKPATAQRRAYWLFFACVLAALAASAVLIAMTGHGQIAAAVGLTQPVTAIPDHILATPSTPDFSNPLRRP